MNNPSVDTLVSIALIAEAQSRLGREADAFMIGVGERIGTACAFDFHGGLDQFAQTMNATWAGLGLGSVVLTMKGGHLNIHHQMPAISHDAVVWRDALPFVIEGIYRGWFRNLGPQGVVSRVEMSGNELEFIFSE